MKGAKGTRVLVTGANRGIGLEFVRQVTGAGCEVVATARDVEAASDLAELGATVLPLDVGSEESVASFSQALETKAFDLVIHNAGVYGPRGEQNQDQMDYDAWSRVLNINTLGAFRVAMATKRALMQGAEPTFAVLTSKMGSIADTSGGSYIYRSSKAALNVTMASLAQDWRSLGIKVAVLHPGWVRTDMGGPNALIDVEESVSGMLDVIGSLSAADTGSFFNYDGSRIPW